MKLSDLAKQPQLIKITMDDADIIEEHGEAIEFWTWDRQPMDTFLKLASLDQNNVNSIIGAVRDLILDEAGKPVLTEGVSLPTKLMLKVITRVVEGLGK